MRPAHALQALRAIVLRELIRFARQKGRLVSALVRPVLWLAVAYPAFTARAIELYESAPE